MKEIIFIVEESEQGGFTAKGLGVSIFTQEGTYDAIKIAVLEAVHCHFDDGKKRIIRLHTSKMK